MTAPQDPKADLETALEDLVKTLQGDVPPELLVDTIRTQLVASAEKALALLKS